jgi:hypothetical protein
MDWMLEVVLFSLTYLFVGLGVSVWVVFNNDDMDHPDDRLIVSVYLWPLVLIAGIGIGTAHLVRATGKWLKG